MYTTKLNIELLLSNLREMLQAASKRGKQTLGRGGQLLLFGARVG